MLKLTPPDTDFPALLLTIPDWPEQLYTEGAALGTLMQENCLAVVGSRRVSAYGRQVTQKLVAELARRGIVTTEVARGRKSIVLRLRLPGNAP